MCAIIGWAGQINNDILRQMYYKATPSGPHSVGLAVKNKRNRIEVTKRAVHPHKFLSDSYRKVKRASTFELGFGHTRWATHGDVIDENAHPFEHEGIIFCHNGIISNYLSITPRAVVDSECLGPLIKDRDCSRFIGSGSTAYFEGGRLYVYRRNQRLCCTTFLTAGQEPLTIFASAKHMIPQSLFDDAEMVIENEIKEGVAYEVTTGGLRAVWKDPGRPARYQSYTYNGPQSQTVLSRLRTIRGMPDPAPSRPLPMTPTPFSAPFAGPCCGSNVDPAPGLGIQISDAGDWRNDQPED